MVGLVGPDPLTAVKKKKKNVKPRDAVLKLVYRLLHC